MANNKFKNPEDYFKKDDFLVVHPNESLDLKEVGLGFDSLPEVNELDENLEEREPKKDSLKNDDLNLIKASPLDYDLATIIKSLNWHMDKISEKVIGREEIIRQAIFAILTGEHLLLLSRTGMAKSYLANYIFNIFTGARLFASQASKDQTPDNYFGPYNIEEFKKGRIKHNIKGSIIEANFVFLDEFFDASDVVLRSLLSVLNERRFINGSEQIDVSIHTAIATANYMRMNEVTEALLDRFTYKSIIPEDYNVYKQLLIDQTYATTGGKPQDFARGIFFEQILFLHDIIKNKNKEMQVVVPEIVYFVKNIVVNRFISEMRKNDNNFFLSPRKQAKISDFLKAWALLNNRLEVVLDDLKEIYLCICTLNSYISVKTKDKSEKDVFEDICQQTMVHLNASGALPQIEFLLKVKDLFQELKENPDKKEQILSRKGLWQVFRDIFSKIFPQKKKIEDEQLTIETLKKNLDELNPALEEVRELRDGLLQEYRKNIF